MDFHTADLCDSYGDELEVMPPVFRAFGRKLAFSGPAHPVLALEDNSLVRAALETEGEGRVLVVDGGGSVRCALVGDRLATLAIDNGWAGIVVFGAIRDAAEIDTMPVGIHALATHPRRSQKRGQGVAGEPVRVAGVMVAAGDWIYADADGVIVARRELPRSTGTA